MGKKRGRVIRVIGFLILAILIIFLVFLLIYAFGSKKEVSSQSTGEEQKGSVFEELIGKITNKTRLFGGGGAGSGGSGGGSSGGGGGGGGSSGGSASGTSGTSGGTSGSLLLTDETICKNAQSNNLCLGLDITYGEGYKEACCSERSLCC